MMGSEDLTITSLEMRFTSNYITHHPSHSLLSNIGSRYLCKYAFMHARMHVLSLLTRVMSSCIAISTMCTKRRKPALTGDGKVFFYLRPLLCCFVYAVLLITRAANHCSYPKSPSAVLCIPSSEGPLDTQPDCTYNTTRLAPLKSQNRTILPTI